MKQIERSSLQALSCLALLVLLTGCVSAGSYCWSDLPPVSKEALTASEGARKAYRLLEQAEEFASAHIGVAGAPSCQVLAFQKLLRDRDAGRAFARLVENGTLEGQLYGLAGLYFADRAAFDRLLPQYRVMEEPVRVQLGCVLQSLPVATVVVSPSSIDPSSLPAWHKENPLAEYPPVDIASGGWSLEFKNAYR